MGDDFEMGAWYPFTDYANVSADICYILVSNNKNA